VGNFDVLWKERKKVNTLSKVTKNKRTENAAIVVCTN